VALIDYHDIDELKNGNEEKVWMAIEHHLGEDSSLCRCRDCILDTAAIALNTLKPRYHVYSFHEKASEEEEAELLEEEIMGVCGAFNKVTPRPHHF
jgi:competence protein ComFB